MADSKCNIEVQRSNNDDHLKRARFNASSITVKESEAAKKFSHILELYIIYISEFDFLKEEHEITQKETRLEAIRNLIQNSFDKETILKLKYTNEEYREAEASLSQLA